jgi:predicted outer membrane repeat protein
MGSYTGEISFSGKTITLWGQEKVLDAAGGGRFFSGGSLLEECWFVAGAARCAGSLLELHDVVLQNGQSSSGGAIISGSLDAYGANVEIYDSTFESNTATEAGGAIYSKGTCKIYDTIIQSNTAYEGAGAIYVYGQGTLEIYNSNFERNQADPDSGNDAGGAIYVTSGSDVKVYTSIFESNSAGNVRSPKSGLRNFLNFLRSNSRRGTCNF